MEGGEILGSPGKTGAAYDICSKNISDHETLCYTINNMSISKIYFFDYLNNKTLLKHVNDIQKFKNIIENSQNLIAKTYYSSNNENDFYDEIKSIAVVYKCYNNDINTYTTLGHFPKYNNTSIIGAIIYENNNSSPYYYTFQSKCNQRFREIFTKNKIFTSNDMNVFIENIIQSIIILQKNDIAHGDIKFDNIMTECNEGKAYKLIDWNMAKELSLKNFKKFSFIKPYLRGSSPVYYSQYELINWRFYIDNYIRDCMLENFYHTDIIADKCKTYARLCYSHFYNDIIPSYKNTTSLFKDLRFTTDLWSIGLMIYFISIKCNLPEYVHIADILCLLNKSPYTNDYVKNASEALYIFKNLNFKINNSCGILKNTKGAHGMLIDLCCDLNIESIQNYVLCKYISGLIENKKIKHLSIVTPEIKKIKLSLDDALNFAKSLQRYNNKDTAVKYYFNPKYAEGDFKDDIKNAHIIDEIYQNHKKMITNQSIQFKKYSINGVIIKNKDNSEHYFYFSKMCSQTIDEINFDSIKLHKFISNILSSLYILHSKNYYHGDIKAQNIMLCKGFYKLIDWGRLYPIKDFDQNYYYGGSMQAGSPLGFYFLIRKRIKIITRNTAANLAVKLFEGSIPFISHKSPLFHKKFKNKFKPLWDNIKNNFIDSVSKYSDIELFNKYKYTLDLYNLGLTILYIIYKNNINIKNYKKFIKKLVLYNDDMITNTKDTIRYFNILN